MPKRTRAPPAAAAMPKGQVFRQSKSVKKQKQDVAPAAKATTLVAKTASKASKDGASVSASPAKVKDVGHKVPKSILKSESENGVDAARPSQRSVTANSRKGKERDVSAARKAPKEEKEQTRRSTHVPRTFRVIVGSYERMLFGYHVKLLRSDEEEEDGRATVRTSFTPLFSFAAHTSCITSVAAAGADSKWLATGAGDETIRVWDLRKRKEVGGLTGHGGTIHSLSFPMRTYLLSADSSGLINLYRTRDWALLKTLRGHTGRVNACQAHASGKVALSVGQDGMLRMWDLMRGKGAGAVRLFLGQANGETEDGRIVKNNKKEEPLDVQWSPNGERFVVLARTEVAIFQTNMNKLASVVVRHDDPKNKFGCVSWLEDDVVLCGTESGAVDVYALQDDLLRGPICKLVGHTNRVKQIRTTVVRPFAHDAEPMRLAVTASSDGKVRVFDLSHISKTSEQAAELSPLGTHDTGGARLTSLDVVGGAGVRTAATDTAETDVEADMDDDDGEGDDDAHLGGADESEAELDADEVQELNDLLDLIDEAREQGIDVEGMSDLDALAGSDDDDDGSEDEDDDEFDDEGNELESEEVEEEEEEEE